MQFRQAKHQNQSGRYSEHKPEESPPPGGGSSGDWFANSSAGGFNRRPNEHWIVGFEDVFAPGRNDYLRIRSCS
jgi:hypothetical protein